MVINLPCLNSKKELVIPEQTATGKESTNLLMADSLPKTIMPTKLVKPQGFNLRPNMGIQTPTKTKDQTLVSKQFDQGIQSLKMVKNINLAKRYEVKKRSYDVSGNLIFDLKLGNSKICTLGHKHVKGLPPDRRDCRPTESSIVLPPGARLCRPCLYCDKKYMPGHKYGGQVFSLEVVGIDLDEDSDLLLTKEGVVNTYPNLVDEPPLISLNVMSGVNTYRTIRARRCMSKNTLHVLVDLRSTHNFLDLHTAKKLGYKVRKVCPLDVSIANGNVMTSLYECKGFTWVFQGVTYNVVVMIFPLRGCDMVLRFNGYLLWDAYDGTLKL
ncbi:hypothetical protein Tco_0884919, partial [Tanacetum coccineum]